MAGTYLYQAQWNGDLNQDGVTNANGSPEQQAGIVTAGGSLLVAALYAYNLGVAALPYVAGITDSAGNTWTFSGVPNSQNPPAFAVANVGFAGLAYCINARAVTSVTATLALTGGAGYAPDDFRLTVYEFRGVPAGATVDYAAAVASEQAGVALVDVPVTTTRPDDAVVAVSYPISGWANAAGPYSSSFDLVSAAGIAPAPGSNDVTFSSPYNTGTQNNFGYAALAVGSGAAGGPQRIWPAGGPTVDLAVISNTDTAATGFTPSADCCLTGIWFYSRPGAASLPTVTALFDEGTQQVVAGSQDNSPSWSGAPGSGWVRCAYAYGAVPLSGGTAYRAAVQLANTDIVVTQISPVTFPQARGIIGSVTGGWYGTGAGSLVYPGTAYQMFLVDAEVTPVASGSGLLMASGII